MIQKTLGRIPETTIEQILRQTGASIRRLTHLLERLKVLEDINEENDLDELLAVAGNSLPALPR